ncbi:hypothetical protein A5759_15665 [Mycobacterium sp. 852014-52144_SCH5372336]|nr:hypothetical protein A5759_15665 [Mycobacterium sp. 852014-52144_SCH5372336]
MGDDVELPLGQAQNVVEVDGDNASGDKGSGDSLDQSVKVVCVSEGVAGQYEVGGFPTAA